MSDDELIHFGEDIKRHARRNYDDMRAAGQSDEANAMAIAEIAAGVEQLIHDGKLRWTFELLCRHADKVLARDQGWV